MGILRRQINPTPVYPPVVVPDPPAREPTPGDPGFMFGDPELDPYYRW